MSNTVRRTTVTFVIVFILAASALFVSALAQDSQTAAVPPTLEDLSNPTKMLTPAQLEEVASNGVQHESASVRRRALLGVAQRLRLAQFQGGLNTQLTASDAHTAFEALRPFIQNAMGDTDEQVRHTAVIAIGALGLSGTARSPSLDRPTLEIFAGALSSEPSAMVRAEMMKIVALTPASDSQLRQQLLIAGLDSETPAVVTFALRGVSDDRVESAAPRVVQLLQHDDRAVRLLAAATLERYPSLSPAHLPAIRAARDGERDVSTKHVLNTLVVRLEAVAP
jgi:HEAT repeat protein